VYFNRWNGVPLRSAFCSGRVSCRTDGLVSPPRGRRERDVRGRYLPLHRTTLFIPLPPGVPPQRLPLHCLYARLHRHGVRRVIAWASDHYRRACGFCVSCLCRYRRVRCRRGVLLLRDVRHPRFARAFSSLAAIHNVIAGLLSRTRCSSGIMSRSAATWHGVAWHGCANA